MGQKKKIVIDTNVLVSALGWDGKPRELLRRVINREVFLFTSHEIIGELSRVFKYPKFNFSESKRKRFLELILKLATIVEPQTKLDVVKDDTDDNMFIECAVECGAGYIISGDRHLLSLREYNNIKIITVSEFLNS